VHFLLASLHTYFVCPANLTNDGKAATRHLSLNALLACVLEKVAPNNRTHTCVCRPLCHTETDVSFLSRTGAFIVCEGVDRCGKSTQCSKLVEHLKASDVSWGQRGATVIAI